MSGTTPWYIVIVISSAVLFVLAWRFVDALATRARVAVLTRRRHRTAAGAESRARAMMSELCPHGWRAQLTLFVPGDELPPGAPEGERARVALDWAEVARDGESIAVTRRVWAPTIADALEAMVADRRTDETLERIERNAIPEGVDWSDV